MDRIVISKHDAKKYLLYKQGLLGKNLYYGKEGALDFIKNVRCLQYDPINVCGKNAEIILQSRVANFKKEMLADLLYKERELFDYWDKNMAILPIEDWKYFSIIRDNFKKNGKSLQQVNAVRDQIMEKVATKGVVCSKDFDFNMKTDWHWNSTNLGRAALESLYFRGDLIIHHKEVSRKYYSLAEQFIPSEILYGESSINGEWDFFLWRLCRRIKSVGLLWNKSSDAWLNIDKCTAANRNQAFQELMEKNQIKEIFIEETSIPFYLVTEELPVLYEALSVQTETDRMEFIAPLDNLMWDRKLIEYLFGFHYKWEIYTPVSQRKYGYYVLPILHNEQLIGRIEMENDKKNSTLNIKNIWAEPGTNIPEDILNATIKRFAAFNDCQTIKNLITR